jgi:hypothetical protein
MVKTYETVKLEAQTYRRFRRAKHLLEFQNDREYSVSEFVDALIDTIGKNLVSDFNKMEKKN